MAIKGFQGTSLLDFPGRVAALVFYGGCNLTCPFCHNPALVLEPHTVPDLNPDELLDELRARQPFIDGVVVSGGEPTIDPQLPVFLEHLKRLNLAVKLDTNGLAPQVVQQLLAEKLIDFLAIDLKTSLQCYPQLHCRPVDPQALLTTVELVMHSAIPVEFRTTCVPGWVDADVVREWGERIRGASCWAFQQFHPAHALAEQARQLPCWTEAQIRGLADLARNYVAEVRVRGL